MLPLRSAGCLDSKQGAEPRMLLSLARWLAGQPASPNPPAHAGPATACAYREQGLLLAQLVVAMGSCKKRGAGVGTVSWGRLGWEGGQ